MNKELLIPVLVFAMILLRLQLRTVFFLKRIRDCLSRTRENRYPFDAENRKKSWIRQSISTIQ
jgi:hypothetical protein